MDAMDGGDNRVTPMRDAHSNGEPESSKSATTSTHRPPCDFCQKHNLKCDNALPFCDNCRMYDLKNCTYTPPGFRMLTTPSLPSEYTMSSFSSYLKESDTNPRCDYCRVNCLQCNRARPICDTCSRNNIPVCKYAPPPPPQPARPGGLPSHPDGLSPNGYASKQQYISQRGVPRCDYCRQHNLKCDRALPTCNVCQANRLTNCTYTTNFSATFDPRSGRCDRCQSHNLKCDRTTPSCNFCQAERARCSYPGTDAPPPPSPRQNQTVTSPSHQSPKNGHSPVDPRLYYTSPTSANGTSSQLKPNASPIVPNGVVPTSAHDRPPYHHDVTSSRSSGSGHQPSGPRPIAPLPIASSSKDPVVSSSPQITPKLSLHNAPIASPRSRANSSSGFQTHTSVFPVTTPSSQSNSRNPTLSENQHQTDLGKRASVPLRFQFEHESVPKLPATWPQKLNWMPGHVGASTSPSLTEPYGLPQCVTPWVHPMFIPLPPHILQRLSSIPSNDMPDRTSFNDYLEQFLLTLMPELRETSSFSAETYAAICRGLQKNDLQYLSLRRRTWTIIHRILSGSSKGFLLLMPRDKVFDQKPEEQERLRFVYQEKMDVTFPSQPSRTLKIDPSYEMVSFKGDRYHCLEDDPEWMSPFERVPVQSQIYDVLAYAHRQHESSWKMVTEVRKAGIAMITWPMCETFVRLCPICTARASSK